MKQWVFRIFGNHKKRIGAVVVLGLLFILMAFFFVGNEMVQNRAYVLKNYEAQQQDMTRELAQLAQEQFASGDTLSDVIEDFQASFLNGSYRWCFLAQSGKLLQAKDANYFESLKLQEITTVKKLRKSCRDSGQMMTMVSFEDEKKTEYTVGIVSDVNNVLLEHKVTKHTTYVMMALALVCMLFFTVLLACLLLLSKREIRIEKLQEELTQCQQHLETMSEEVGRIDEQMAERFQGNLREYDDELVHALLQKSTHASLFPMGILYFQWQMGDRYVQKGQFQQLIENMRKLLTKDQILLEYAKGEFVLLAYRIEQKKLPELKERMIQGVQSDMEQLQITVRVETAFLPDEEEENTEAVFTCLQSRIHPEKGENYEKPV